MVSSTSGLSDPLLGSSTKINEIHPDGIRLHCSSLDLSSVNPDLGPRLENSAAVLPVLAPFLEIAII